MSKHFYPYWFTRGVCCLGFFVILICSDALIGDAFERRPQSSRIKICQPDNCTIGTEGFHRQLMEDFDGNGEYKPFTVKGVSYSPTPIGQFYAYASTWSALCTYTGPEDLIHSEDRYITPPPGSNYFNCGDPHFYHDTEILDRDFRWIEDMGANTIRTWGKVTPVLLDKAEEYSLKVIAGFWVDHHMDYIRDDLQPVIDDFLAYVGTYQDHPSVLMWGLSNENNMAFCSFERPDGEPCDIQAQAAAFFTLVNQMAVTAKQSYPHLQPIIVVTAETLNMEGVTDLLGDMDVLGINSYRGPRFGDMFDHVQRMFPSHPVVVTEFGFDAYDSRQKSEDELAQALGTIEAWEDIRRHNVAQGGSAIGGVVFTYVDGWEMYKPKLSNPNLVNGQWTPSVAYHDTGYIYLSDGTVWGAGQPDGRYNIEWAGIMAAEKDPDGGIDRMRPRRVYGFLQKAFME